MSSMPPKPRISPHKRHLLVCTGPRCTRHGESEALFLSLKDRLDAAGLSEGVARAQCLTA